MSVLSTASMDRVIAWVEVIISVFEISGKRSPANTCKPLPYVAMVAILTSKQLPILVLSMKTRAWCVCRTTVKLLPIHCYSMLCSQPNGSLFGITAKVTAHYLSGTCPPKC